MAWNSDDYHNLHERGLSIDQQLSLVRLDASSLSPNTLIYVIPVVGKHPLCSVYTDTNHPCICKRGMYCRSAFKNAGLLAD